MMFFAMMAGITLIAWLIGRAGIAPLRSLPACMRWGLALALIFFGTDHLLTPERYLPMMPGLIPYPHAVVLFTGLCEIAGAIGLLVPRTRRLAGIMLAIYFICVFPANIRNAIYGLTVDGLPVSGWYYWVRLLFQPLVIWWSLYAAQVIGVKKRGTG